MNIKLLVLFLALVMIGGCSAPQPSAPQPHVYQRPHTNIDWGTPPDNHEAQIKMYFQGILKDPTSAIYTIEKPVRGYTNYGFKGKKNSKNRAGQVIWTGWVSVVLINAKNSYGGYTGNQRYYAMFNSDKSFKEARPEVRKLGSYRIPHGVRFY